MLLSVLTLSACSTAVVPPPERSVRLPAIQVPPKDRHGVIGADARALVRLFGKPRLDIRDPAVRKLQFANAQCVLDTYLYPTRDQREPVVTYAEARSPDSKAMDWVVCAQALRRR